LKILFINKYDITGGAAIAARRISEALISQFGTENLFLVGIRKSRDPQVRVSRKKGWQNNLERGLNRLTSWLGLQYYYFPLSTPRIRMEVKQFRPDIICLHNIHGGYFDTRLVRELSEIAPVIWTLHDMWAFTANAAHTFGEESWKKMQAGPDEHRSFPQTGLNRGKALIRRKKNIYARSRLILVCPSRWLQDMACQSPVLEGKRIEYIPNGVDLVRFCPADRALAKKKLGIDPARTVLTFSAEKLLSSPYKGGLDLLEILRDLDNQCGNQQLHALMIGKDRLPLDLKQMTHTNTGYLDQEARMIQCYQATDIFLYPTRADTLPFSLIEASACGVPGISYDVGGCREIIRDKISGHLIPPSDRQSFVQCTLNLAGDAALRESFSRSARETAVTRFDIRRTAQAYHDLSLEALMT